MAAEIPVDAVLDLPRPVRTVGGRSIGAAAAPRRRVTLAERLGVRMNGAAPPAAAGVAGKAERPGGSVIAERIAATPKPAIAERTPQVAGKPGTAEKPAAFGKPAIAAKPAPLGKPVIADKPAARDKPAIAEKPAAPGKPTAAPALAPAAKKAAPPLEQRARATNFRDVLSKGLATCRKNLITVAIFSFFVNCFVLGIPIYLFQISDRVLTSRSGDTLVMLTIVVLGAILAHIFLDVMRRFILMRIAVEAESKLGAPVLSAAAKASQAGSSKDFQTLSDLQHMRSFITGPVLLTMLDAPVAPVYLLFTFLIHPHLGMIVTVTAVVLLCVALANQRLTAASFAQANGFAARANLQADALARNAQVINAMGMIPEGVAMWGRETSASLKAQVSAQDRNIMMTGLSKFIRLGTQIGMLGWGAWLSLNQEVTGGMVVAASIVASRALAPVEGTIEGWRSFVQAQSAYRRIKALLQNSPLNIDRLRLPKAQGRLTVERVLYVPPPQKKVILNGITFQLEPGESLVIVGASGSGKSTLGRMLVGSITPTAGNVRLDAMDLRNWDPRQFGESIGYLPQDVQLFPASIKANIARMREDFPDSAIFEAAALADVHEMISEFPQGYETQVGMDGSPLSGGQKQRIGLARAFFGDPRLVVLDEPNSNLDAAGEQALARALVRAKERRITIVAITQRPALLKSVDKIMVIKDGTVVSFGKRDDVLPLVFGRKVNAGSQPQAIIEG